VSDKAVSECFIVCVF